MTGDREVFDGFVFEGQDYPPKRVEEAMRAVQPHLGSGELRRVNEALLARLAEAKARHPDIPKRALLDDPAISQLVNTLVLANKAWINTVIARNINGRQRLSGSSVQELFSTALTGGGAVGGVMNAILEYDYEACGVAAFSPYLARAIGNALVPPRKQGMHYWLVDRRTGPLAEAAEAGAGRAWVDRSVPPPETVAADRELLEVVRSVIPRLASPQQRRTAAWMIDRILATGKLPMAREVALIQFPPVSRERGRQIMESTVDGICRQIEAAYPSLAEQGVNGWEAFSRAFSRKERGGR